MSDTAIPEDIIDVAEMTWAALEDADGIRECVLTIAIALNAARQTERERCAKIAEGKAKEFDFQMASDDCRDEEIGFNSARLHIARAIVASHSKT